MPNRHKRIGMFCQGDAGGDGSYWVEGDGAGAAAWVTVNPCPAIVSVPFRAAPVFAATLKPTDPLPLPDAPDVTVMNPALLAAVHVHPLAVVTVTVPVVAPGPTL
jgi:hypothetical protein